MPIYEYLCRACRKRSALLVLSRTNPPVAACRHCGSADVDRIFSRFASPKSDEARLESLADSNNLGGLDENDPQTMARLMKKMGDATGEDMGDDVERLLESSGDEGLAGDGNDSL